MNRHFLQYRAYFDDDDRFDYHLPLHFLARAPQQHYLEVAYCYTVSIPLLRRHHPLGVNDDGP